MPKSAVQAAFEKQIVVLPLNIIVPQRTITNAQRECDFYRQITASLKHIGLIEPLVVYPRAPGEYLLLEGHVRLEILKSLGVTEAKCLLSTDDEAYTYNRHVNQIPPVAQHFMLLGALKNGLTEERIAAALDVSIDSIRSKRDMLNGICPEVVQILIEKPVSAQVFAILKKMKPIRQIEAAEHMVAGGTYTVPFAKALLAVTRPEMLEEPPSAKLQATSEAARAMLEEENEFLLRDLKSGRGILRNRCVDADGVAWVPGAVIEQSEDRSVYGALPPRHSPNPSEALVRYKTDLIGSRKKSELN